MDLDKKYFNDDYFERFSFDSLDGKILEMMVIKEDGAKMLFGYDKEKDEMYLLQYLL